jgi:hypothetical protein
MPDILGGFKLKRVVSWKKLQEVVEVSLSETFAKVSCRLSILYLCAGEGAYATF